MTDRTTISRRRLVAAGLVAGLAAAGMPPGAAADDDTKESDKVSPAEAHYRNRPNGQQRCAICLQFEPPNRCRIVRGAISPQGWCQYFAARENAR